MSKTPVQTILERLKGVQPDGRNRWGAICPAHGDHARSLSVAQAVDGRCLLHCSQDCSTAEIVRAFGLEIPDLYSARMQKDAAPLRRGRRRLKSPPDRSGGGCKP